MKPPVAPLVVPKLCLGMRPAKLCLANQLPPPPSPPCRSQALLRNASRQALLGESPTEDKPKIGAIKPRFALSRIVFFGAGAFAVPALRKLARDGAKSAGVEIALVVSSPPRPAGRKMALRASPVAAEARELGLEVAEVSTPADAIAKIREIGARSFVVCDYGRILPRGLLRLPRDGGLNIHASLLPRWRGASPVRSAILAGDETTGVTIMKMDTGMDTGMILLSRETPIAPDETGGALSERLSAMGAEMIVETLNSLRDLEEFPQLGRATYAGKLGAEERWLNFQNPAEVECRRIRAFAPTPGARLILRGTEIKVLSGSISEIRGEPGKVLSADATGIVLGCGGDEGGGIILTRMQRSGGREMSSGDFLRGFKVEPGDLAQRRQ